MSAVALVLAGLGLVALSGFPALALKRGSEAGDRIANWLVWLGALAGSAGAILTLVEGPSAWHFPSRLGLLGFRADAVSAMFLLQGFVIAAAGSTYGLAYWPSRSRPDSARKLRLFYGLTVAGLSLVFCAADGVTFLVGWEVMALSAFLALTADDRAAGVRDAGRLYLFCTRAGTLALIALFIALKPLTGGFLFAPVAEASSGIFVLALFAFGLKAGAMPLHVWLPGAHANAPSHVSALFSGVLIKTGIYGLVRVLGLFEAPPGWWGGVIFALGATSSVLGVAFAIGQHDLKRLLAYHSIENIGIILMGLGLALTGRSLGLPALFSLGLAGALLHSWNHGLFKALLFLCAGAVIHETGVRSLDLLGGLARRMPKVALGFLIGAVAICGLPPLNGFVSEFLIYSGLLRALLVPGGRTWLFGALGIPALALTGGLALLCFAKVYGIVFLGAPRSEIAGDAGEPPAAMTRPLALLAGLCVAIGFGPVAVAPILDAAVASFPGPLAPPLAEQLPLLTLSALALGLTGLLALLGWFLRRGRARVAAPTWGCGYPSPTPRMQYTASSFAETIVGLFSWALLPVRTPPRIEGPFPQAAALHTRVQDAALELLLLPAAHAAARGLAALHWLQRGSLQASLLYVLVALLLAFALS